MRITIMLVLLALTLAIVRRRACRNVERQMMDARLTRLAL
jgi:hypothetical protein